jgi:hypothetical protein
MRVRRLQQQAQRRRSAEIAQRLHRFGQHVLVVARRDDGLECRDRLRGRLPGERFRGFAAHRHIG